MTSRLAVALAIVFATSACRDQSAAPAAPPPQAPEDAGSAKADAEAAEKAPVVERRSALQPWRSLLHEAPRAELRAGGLHIDFGTADSFKYIRGGWQNRWDDVTTAKDGTTATKLDGASGPIDFILRAADAEPKEVVVRMRAMCKGRNVSIELDGAPVGDKQSLPEDWTTLRFPIDGHTKAGAHRLSIKPDKSCKKKARAEVDWVWLAEEAGAEPPAIVERVQPIKLGDGVRRGLVAATPRTYSFYLQVPEGGELVFDHASSNGAEFTVDIAADGQEAKEVYRGKTTDTWEEGSADLKPWVDKAIRVDLNVAGDAGDGGWGEVEIMVPELPKEADIPNPSAKPKNLVYILIDTQRADSFEPFGGEGSAAVTPTFDALTKDSIVFSRAYNQENWTKPSVATILSGLYPVTHDTSGEEETVPDAVEMLAEHMQKQGLKTGAFIANGYIATDFGFNQGWDHYTNFLREKKNSSAKGVYREAIQWVKENAKQPFFLYVQTIDPHVPWNVADKYTAHYYEGKYKGPIGPSMGGAEQHEYSGSDKLTDDDLKWIHALYNGEVTYHDEHMGKLIDTLREVGVLDDTLLVISNDHGEELQDHGKMGHRHTLYDELIRSPLLMRFPERLPAGEQYDEIVELVDMAPTILDIMGMPPSEVHEGNSLVPLIERQPLEHPRYAISEYEYNSRYNALDIEDDEKGLHARSVIVGNWKMWRDHREHKELFNVGEDPEEKNNLLGKAPIALRLTDIYLAEGLANPSKKARLLNRVSKKQFEAGKVEIKGELRKQLEALGYFGEK